MHKSVAINLRRFLKNYSVNYIMYTMQYRNEYRNFLENVDDANWELLMRKG